jgi:predicted RNA-binding Zn-ribbon protein involved in translation (DUF1610 family)
MTTPKIALKVIVAPSTGHVVDAPPVLMASEHSVDYTCGSCGTVLLHANHSQVYGLLIHCKNCGSYNATEQ